MNNIETYKLESAQGYIVFKKDEQYILFDTGNPTTMDKGSSLSTLLGINFDQFETNLGIPVGILMGCNDIAKQKVLIDFAGSTISFGDDLELDGKTIKCLYKSVNVLGMQYNCPFIDAVINERNVMLVFDTGAPISYANKNFLEETGALQIGEKTDFHPNIGTFQLPLYKSTVEIAGEKKDVELGVLPNSMETALSMQYSLLGLDNVVGIIGGIIIHNHKVLLDFAHDQIIIQ